MDPSSSYAMQGLIGLKERFDVAFACDPDHDRHGIVTPSGGLLAPNNYLAVSVGLECLGMSNALDPGELVAEFQ